MYAKYQCFTCIIKHAQDIFEKCIKSLDDEKQSDQEFLYRSFKILIDEFIEDCSWKKRPIEISNIMYDNIYKYFGKKDYFYEEKLNSNKKLLGIYDLLYLSIINSEDPILSGAKLSSIGNMIDYGIKNDFGELEWEIENLMKSKNFSINHVQDFKNELAKAKEILYILDNSGEIVLDKIFMKTIKSNYPEIKITAAVRSTPVINDVTLEEADFVKLDEVAEIIESGSFYAGTILNETNDRFKKLYNDADIIISKGQGNFEGLNEKNNKPYFILMAKCQPIANALGVKIGDLIFGKVSSLT